MKIAKLTKVAGKSGPNIGKNPLRGTEIDGFYVEKPTCGQSFTFYSRPLTPGATYRLITTSVVAIILPQERHPDAPLRFKTLNSAYELIPIEAPEWMKPLLQGLGFEE